MDNSIFAVSDIHGQYTAFQHLLRNWDPAMPLVILGDCIDRGKDSPKVISKIIELQHKYENKVVVLRGNHEDMLLTFLDNPTETTGLHYFRNGGDLTIKQFTEQADLSEMCFPEIAEQMKAALHGFQSYFDQLKAYYEFGDLLFIHAGIDHTLADWRETDPYQMVWIREGWLHENKTGKIIVFGHTPTRIIHRSESNDVWISENGSYIGIDGGSVYGGQLNGVVLTDKGRIVQCFAEKADSPYGDVQ
ncbi:metallophosphoesterase family protein [Bacillus testis]|uniref:metallophosphoesterase family protein n=1 Tax=Bacillus testis TaxID=1622072 RepID=UPI00067E69C6|nr:metallophosphoesterase family protein [Bacillus testis]